MDIVKIILAFLLMLAVGLLTFTLLASDKETIEFKTEKSGIERLSPADHIKEDQIKVTKDDVQLKISDARWSKFTDTNSMDPVFDVGNNVIKISPKNKEEISPGDIISYDSEYYPDTLIHRVVEIGEDEEGWYAIAKGDNNLDNDPGNIRFSQIRFIAVTIIY